MIGNDRSAQATNECSEEIKEVVDENRLRLGNFADLVDVPYAGAGSNSVLAYARMGYFHIHGPSFILPDEDPVLVSSAAPAWTIGDIQQIIAVDQINYDFDLHWASISDISATLQGMIYFYTREDDLDEWVFLRSACDVVRTTYHSRENQSPIMVAPIKAGTAIGLGFKDDTGAIRSCKIKVYGHVYHPTLE